MLINIYCNITILYTISSLLSYFLLLILVATNIVGSKLKIQIRNFTGGVSLVTGGASGLGKATVERLVQQGSRVVLCDLPSSKGNEVAKSLGEENVLFAPVNVINYHKPVFIFL